MYLRDGKVGGNLFDISCFFENIYHLIFELPSYNQISATYFDYVINAFKEDSFASLLSFPT